MCDRWETELWPLPLAGATISVEELFGEHRVRADLGAFARIMDRKNGAPLRPHDEMPVELPHSAWRGG